MGLIMNWWSRIAEDLPAMQAPPKIFALRGAELDERKQRRLAPNLAPPPP